MNGNKVKKLFDSILLIIVFSSLFLFLGVFVRGQKIKSNLEGRDLNKYERFSFSSFLRGEYQSSLEDFLTDQLILSGTIKKQYHRLEAKMINKIMRVNDNKEVSEEKEILTYIQIKDNVYKFQTGDALFDKYIDFDSKKENLDVVLDNYAKTFDELDVPVYIYYYSSSRSKDLSDSSEDKFYVYIKEKLEDHAKISSFVIKDYEDYKKYFYKTDHHLNYIGQYKGYTDMMDLLNISTVIKPIEEINYDIPFYGSYSRLSLDDSLYDDFIAYKFDIPSYKTYIYGKQKTYGNKASYDNGTYSKDKFANRYADYYGYDFKEVVYDFNSKDKKNLLLLGTSYSNAVNDLIAMNYNKTYVVDLRHYENFNIKKYIKNNKIDEVLLMGDIYSFAGAPLFGGGK